MHSEADGKNRLYRYTVDITSFLIVFRMSGHLYFYVKCTLQVLSHAIQVVVYLKVCSFLSFIDILSIQLVVKLNGSIKFVQQYFTI